MATTIATVFDRMEEVHTDLTQNTNTQTALTTKFQYSAQQVYNGLATMIVKEMKSFGQTPQANEDLKACLRKVAMWLSMEQQKDLRWLMMYGKCGTGKSTVLRAINTLLDTLHENNVWMKKANFSYRLIKARELSEMYISDRPNFMGIINYHLLMIDDIGTERRTELVYGNEMRPILEMFQYRYDNRYSKKLATIFTSNIDPEELGTWYDDTIYSRARETCMTVKFNGNDLRQQVQWKEVEPNCPF